MSAGLLHRALTVVVGSGGVGKTTAAAALALDAARAGHETLVITFDPSLRLKDALGVGANAADTEVRVDTGTHGELFASLLDVRTTFDRLVRRYAPDEHVAARIFRNRLYSHLSGTLAGVLEYMAVERLFEIASLDRFSRVVLDTPPTRQAIDFLDAPSRMVGFLDSGALRVALKPWFDEDGHLRPARRLGPLGRGVEAFFDRMVGLGLLRDMSEFFQAFGPLYDGFRQRAAEVGALLRSDRTGFVLVTRPEEERVPETLFFARRLQDRGHHVDAVIVNMVHPVDGDARDLAPGGDPADGRALLAWMGARDAKGVAAYRARLPRHPLVDVPLFAGEPNDLAGLEQVRGALAAGFARAKAALRPVEEG
jgi:anion-transporting  ArsA/GET3 family ATPase